MHRPSCADAETLAEAINRLAEAIERIESSSAFELVGSLGRLLTPAEPTPATPELPALDPMMSPTEAAKYLGISVKTLSQNWQEKYKIKHSGHVKKDRRYLLSELERVKRLHFQNGKGAE